MINVMSDSLTGIADKKNGKLNIYSHLTLIDLASSKGFKNIEVMVGKHW